MEEVSKISKQSLFNCWILRLHLAGQEGKNVFVLSIPDWGVMPFAEGRDRAQIAQEIDQFNRMIQTVCRDKNIAYFDITAISREGKD